MLAAAFTEVEVASIHKQAVQLSNKLMDIIANDITYLSGELQFWRNMSDQSNGRRYLTAQLLMGPQLCMSKLWGISKSILFNEWPTFWILSFNESVKVELLHIDNELFRKASLIRSSIEDRVKLLARVNKVICRLRYVFLVVDGVDRGPETIANLTTPNNVTESGYRDISPQDEALIAFSRREVRRALDELHEILNCVIDADGTVGKRVPTHAGNLSGVESATRSTLAERMVEVAKLYGNLELKLYKGHCRNIIDDTIQRPSLFRQNWLSYTFLTIGSGFLARFLFRYIQSGQMQKTLWYMADLLFGKVREHIVEPLQDLVTNVFDTLKRDPIVTHEELVQSNLALNRMLDAYSEKRAIRDSYTGPDDMKQKIFNQASSIKSSSSNSLGDNKVRPAATKRSELNTSSAKNKMATTRQALAMEELMRDYEAELQTPIRGLLFGELITSVLIQMQELKVHTESAMLTMDQVLASNELTIAFSAAIPAFALLGGALYLFNSFVRSKFFKPIQHIHGGIPKLRIALAEIIRSLHDVEDGEIDPLAPSNVEDGWYGRGTPPICSSQSEPDLLSPLLRSGSTGKVISSPCNIDMNKTSSSNEYGLKISRSVSISQKEIIQNAPSSPRIRFSSPAPAPNSAMKVASTPSNLKVDANVLIKWGKGKDDEYRRGLLIYRIIILFRMILQYLGGDSGRVMQTRMDAGGPPGRMDSKDTIRLLESLGVVEEEYNSLIRDMQDLLLPDFEINLRRKIETATRMQQFYKCFSTA